MKKGLEEGREKRELEIAKQMLEDGEPIEKIKKWTGLSAAKINALNMKWQKQEKYEIFYKPQVVVGLA